MRSRRCHKSTAKEDENVTMSSKKFAVRRKDAEDIFLVVVVGMLLLTVLIKENSKRTATDVLTLLTDI